jgi:hypothetical protein
MRSGAHELGPYQVAVVSLWPPLTSTEKVLAKADRYELSGAHSPWFTGRAVAALAADPQVMQRTGQALAVVDLADEYGFGDLDPHRRGPKKARDRSLGRATVAPGPAAVPGQSSPQIRTINEWSVAAVVRRLSVTRIWSASVVQALVRRLQLA